MLLSLCDQVILPYVSYCIHVWGKTYGPRIKRVLVLHNNALRVIAGVPPPAKVDNLYLHLDVISVLKISAHPIAIFMHTCAMKYS